MAGTKKINSDLDLQGKAIISTVPNSTGTVVTWNPTSKEIGTRSNADIISDLGLITATNIAAAYYTKTQLQTPGQSEVNWGNLTDIPTSFPATAHNHDDRYYTETESDTRFVHQNADEQMYGVKKMDSALVKEGDNVRIIKNPKSYYEGATKTGVVIVTLPKGSGARMVDIKLSFQAYADSGQAEIRITGYWYNTYFHQNNRGATVIRNNSPSTALFDTIKTGRDSAGNPVIMFGTETSVFSVYSTLVIDEAIYRFSGFDNPLNDKDYSVVAGITGAALATYTVDQNIVVQFLNHNHSNKTFLDDINQNLGTARTPTFNNITVGYTTSGFRGFSSNLPFAFLNVGQAQSVLSGGVLASNSYADASLIPTNGIYSKGQLRSGVATGTAPFVIASSTLVPNLNADLLDGQHGSYYAPAAHNHSLLTGWANTIPASNTVTVPTDYYSKFEVKGMKANSVMGISNGGTYSTVLGLKGWFDNSGGVTYEMAFDEVGRIHYRTGNGTTWGTWDIFATQSWVTSQGYLTSASLTGYATQSWVTSNFASATHTHSWSQITGKPDFATVATTGNYSDLIGLPTIPTQYTDEMAQDAVGAMASSEFTYNDATNTFGINAIGANKITQSASYRFVTDVEKNTWNAKQAALSGTGFVKISGSTISYDNNTYSLSSHNHTLDSLSNVTINLNTAGEILKWNGTAWVNNTLSEAGIQPAGNYASATHSHTIAQVTGLQAALDGKVDDSQVLTNVPAGAVFTDTVYSHPTNSGNKHIPSGGSANQILRWSADGTAVWSNENNTTYSQATTSILGLVKPFHANLTAPTIQGATATAGRYYGIQLNSSGQMVVNVPWVDTTYPAGTYANIDTSDDKVKVWTGEILKEYFDNYIRTSHAANSVTSTLINNWNTAHGWGNHAGLYLPLTGGQLTGDLSIKHSPSLTLPTHEFKTNQAGGRNDFYLRSDDFSKIIRFTTANSYYLFDIAGGMSASNQTGFDFIQIPAWNSQFRVGYYATQMSAYMSAVSGSSWTGGNMDTGGNVNAGSKVTAEDGFVHNQYDDPNFLLTSDGGVIHKKDSILPKVVQTVQDFQYLDLTVNLEFREYQVIIWNDAATINIPAASSAIMGMKIVIKLVESTTIYYGYPILEVDGNQWGTIFNDHKVGVELVCRGDSWVSTLIGQTTEIVL